MSRYDEYYFKLRGRIEEQEMQELRKRRAGGDEIVEGDAEDAELVIPYFLDSSRQA
jgi:hypothetical protein